jgi:uncharacterized protein YgiM (DUF1202 family)
LKLSRAIFACLMIWAFAEGAAFAAETATALKATEIKAGPYRDAKTIGSLAKGDKVEILARQGGWYQVKSSKGQGWTRMLNIRRGEARTRRLDTGELVGLASGRAGTGQVVATTGIRGLNEEELKKAKYNESEIEKVESFATTSDKARKFAAAGKLKAQKLDYLPPPD